MIDTHAIAAYVVSSSDGDRCSLSELLSAIRSRSPEASHEEVLDACRNTCLDLVREGHLRLDMTLPHANRPGRDGYTLVADEEVPAILTDPNAWLSPRETHACYWPMATESGKAKYISEDAFSL
ncbi:MAG: hypothetical protein ACI8W3_000937 [Myxococcota bacterium]